MLRGVDAQGHVWRPRAGVLVRADQPGVPATEVQSGDWAEIERDTADRFVRGLRADGSAWRAENGVVTEDLRLPTLRQGYGFNGIYGTAALSADQSVDLMILVLGQSLADGGNADAADAPVTVAAPYPGYALMVGDMPWWANGKLMTTYSDLREVAEPGTTIGSKETVCSGMAAAMMPIFQVHLGFMPRVIFASVAIGGNAYFGGAASRNGMKRGSLIYGEALNTVRSARDLSRRQGRRLMVAGAVVIHGEEDHSLGTPQHLYARGLDQWQADIDADVRAITGQADPVRFYLSQVNRGSTGRNPVPVAQAQLEAEDRNPMIRCLGPIYFVDHAAGDGAHPTAASYRRVGLMHGTYLAHDLFGAYDQCLRVMEAWWQTSTMIRLRYPAAIAIEADDARVAISTLGAGKGVDFHDGTVSPPVVTGIAVVASDTIEVTLAAPPTGMRPRLFIAVRTTGDEGMGWLTGARSGIRSDAALVTDSLDSFAVYRWAATQTISLPNPYGHIKCRQ